jgi:transcriptional regulator of aromatic amino acid metabolism
MMTLHSPQLVSLSEATLLRSLIREDRRPNLLIVCNGVSVEAAVRHVVAYCEPPYHLTALPGKLDLPEEKKGTLLLADVAMMSIGQQMRLFDWLPADSEHLQVVSISSVPLRSQVDDGKFLEGLFYRLNVIYLDATRNRAAGTATGESERMIRAVGPMSRPHSPREQSSIGRLRAPA